MAVFFFQTLFLLYSATSLYAYRYHISSRRITTSPICHELHPQVQVTLPDLVYDESLALYLNSHSFTDVPG